MNLCRLLLLPLATLSLAAPLPTIAQKLEPRLHGNLREGNRAVLPGSLPPQVRSAPDLGALPASYPLHGLTLVFRRSPAQQAELDGLLRAQQDPTSPEYHHWLTPETFGERFGVAESDLLTTERWLAAQGFVLTGRSRAHDRIAFSGTAAQVETAFGARLHRYQIDGEPHIAPSTDLSLPADLAAITTAVLHLSDLRPRPFARPTPRPALTTYSGQAHYLTPADLKTMYHLNDTLDGLGHSIAVVGESDPDYGGQISIFGGGTTTPIQDVIVPGTGVEAIMPGAEAETAIDLEYSSGIAPRANIYSVYVGSDPSYNVFDALSFTIDQDFAEVVSVSYGLCETFLSQTDVAQSTALFQQASAQGQTLIAAAGDSGSTGCAPFSVSGKLSSAQQQALAVDYPADCPLVTAVGGTQMAPGTFAPGPSQFWASASGDGSDAANSLLSYVPEVVWNEGSGLNRIVAGGGGASTLFAQPEWQAGVPGIPSGASRLLPDVALQASIVSPGFALCTNDPGFLADQGQTASCVDGLRGSNNQPTLGGGTSFAAPVLAGLVALLNQEQGSTGQGSLNPTLYRLAASSPTLFHDITSGSIACTAGTPLCSAAGQSGFSALSGFDEATGLGSVDFGGLLAALATPQSAKQPTFMTVTPDTSNPGPGASVSVFITVVNNSSTVGGTDIPSGSVSVRVDGTVVNAALALGRGAPDVINSVATFSFLPPQALGSHLLTISYPGDATHQPSRLTVPILVGNLQATGSVALAVGNLSLAANGAGTTPVSITPAGGYNGRLFWSLALTGSSNNTGVQGCYSIPTVAVRGATSATLSLGVGTACSSALPAARQQLRPLPALRSPAPAAATGHQLSTAATAALLLCLLPATRRRTPAPLALLLACSIGTVALSGCGSGSRGSSASEPVSSTPTTAPVTYIFALTGQDSVNSSIQSSTTFTLTLQ